MVTRNDKMEHAGVCCLFILVLTPFVLQTVGSFTTHWVEGDNGDSFGIFSGSCPNSYRKRCTSTFPAGLDSRNLGLQTTSFCIMLLATVGLCCGGFCGSDSVLTQCGVCGFALYPVAGILSIAGCIVVAASGHSTADLGYSFYLCAVAGSLAILFFICFCCYSCKDSSRSEEEERPIAYGSLQPTRTFAPSPRREYSPVTSRSYNYNPTPVRAFMIQVTEIVAVGRN